MPNWPSSAAEVSALYQAYWAGTPAGAIRLSFDDSASAYRSQIDIRTQGMAWLATRFRATVRTRGRLAGSGPPIPAHYDAIYDLRGRTDRRLSMRFTPLKGAPIADRGPEDTSTKPQLPEKFRTNVLDPLSVAMALRQELRRGHRNAFTLNAYDGARRFDVTVRVLPRGAGDEAVRVEMNLVPIAGFKGESSDDPDPDSAPRPVELALSNDERLMPLTLKVSVAHLPMVIQLAQWCGNPSPCDW